jgi:hydrogenase maturation protease
MDDADVGDLPRVSLFACGDSLRGDDAVGHILAASLPPRVLAMADVRIVGALEPEHLTELPAGARVVIVDAVAGPPAGTIVDLDLAALPSQARRLTTTSSHQLSLDRVVALAQMLRDEPLEGRFVGVGIGSVAIGSGLGEEVRAALPTLQDAVARAVESLSQR